MAATYQEFSETELIVHDLHLLVNLIAGNLMLIFFVIVKTMQNTLFVLLDEIQQEI